MAELFDRTDIGANANASVHPTPERTTSYAERVILSALTLIVTIGLAIDTRSHRESARIDSFFTRSHALGYAGSAACGLWILYIVRRRQQAGAKGWRAVPLGLEGATAGLAVYTVGGIGDLIWHSVYGVEQELKILFSPTHLLLMCAMLMLSFGPVRAAWMAMATDPNRWSGLRQFWPVALACGSMATVLNIFLTYGSPYEPQNGIFSLKLPGIVASFEQFAQFFHVSATMGLFLHTIAWFGIILLVTRRWPVPFGTITLMFSVVAVSMWMYFDWTYRRSITALLVGAIAVDVLHALLVGSLRNSRVRFRVFGALAPPLFWTLYLLITRNGAAITWNVEQWTGTIAWSGLLGLGLTVALLPPRLQRATYLD